MKEVAKITTVLTLVCVICAFSLSFVYSTAKEKIAANAKKAVDDAIMVLAPEVEKIEQIAVEDEAVYRLSSSTAFIGYAFIAEGQGYQGKIKILSIIGPKLQKLLGIEIVESIETPGLGAKISQAPFKKQFKNINVTKDMECLKTAPQADGQIQAITGATVSSRAVVNILNKKIGQLRRVLPAEE